MSKTFEVIKTIWKSDRYRSLVILGLYFIFFLVVIILVKTAPERKITPKETGISNIEISNTYDFEISVKDSLITGTYNYSYIKFNYNNTLYEYSNEILLPNSFEYSDIINFMNRSYVFDLIKGKEVYSTTKFSDESIAKTYLIDDIEVTTYDKDLTKIDVKINDLTYKIIYK